MFEGEAALSSTPIVLGEVQFQQRVVGSVVFHALEVGQGDPRSGCAGNLGARGARSCEQKDERGQRGAAHVLGLLAKNFVLFEMEVGVGFYDESEAGLLFEVLDGFAVFFGEKAGDLRVAIDGEM